MCDRIIYKKKGDLYECYRVSDEGEETLLGTGTREDILSWLSSHGLGFVRHAVLVQDLELLCDEE